MCIIIVYTYTYTMLCATGEVLKREWKILRDSMRQALKRSNTGATTKAGLPCKKWRLQSRMAFVLPYMTIRRWVSAACIGLGLASLDRCIVMTSRSGTLFTVLFCCSNPRPVKSTLKADDMEAAPEHEREPEVWEPTHQDNSDHDSLDLFFASVCQSTKRLPRKFQSSIKRQVLDALLRVEEEWEVEQAESKTEVNKIFWGSERVEHC